MEYLAYVDTLYPMIAQIIREGPILHANRTARPTARSAGPGTAYTPHHHRRTPRTTTPSSHRTTRTTAVDPRPATYPADPVPYANYEHRPARRLTIEAVTL